MIVLAMKFLKISCLHPYFINIVYYEYRGEKAIGNSPFKYKI